MKLNYNNDLNVELPFFLEMVRKLNGVKKRDTLQHKNYYQVNCPECGKKKAIMEYFQRANTFGIRCPVNGCVLNKTKGTKALTLNDLIKHHGGTEAFDRWCSARGQFYYKNQWNPIKNRRVGEKSTRKKKTFKEKMQLKSTVFMTKIRSGKYVDPDSYFYYSSKGGEINLDN